MPIFQRHDGALVRDVPATRRIMPFLMRTKASAVVYFEQTIDVTRVKPLLDSAPRSETGKLSIFHLFSYAVVKTLAERPRLNRFVSGPEIYQRNKIELSFAAKKGMSDDEPVAVVKRAFDPAASFDEHTRRLSGGIAEGRSRERSGTDKELSFFLALPGFLLRWLVSLALWLDAQNLLPAALIADDPLYTSLFITNLGSVGLDAAYHHLYDWGNCPIFAALGKVSEKMVNGERRLLCVVRYTFDERIEDGLYCARALGRVRELVEGWEPAIEARAA